MARTKPPGSGRLARGSAPAGIIGIRVSPEERARYTHAAELAGQRLSDWMRSAAEAACTPAAPAPVVRGPQLEIPAAATTKRKARR